LNALSTSQVGALSTSQVRALSTTSLNALSSTNLQALTSTQVRALSTDQLRGLTTSSISNLSTTELQSLTTAQISYLTSTQYGALSTTQFDALSMDQIMGLGSNTPLVLDLNGDGVRTLGINAGVQFDLNANGTKEHVGWVSSEDGLLAIDLNGNKTIDNGSELFGDSTLMPNGQKATDGFQALRAFDSNNDGVINSSDKIYAELKVWKDLNSNGITDDGELNSIEALGVESINLAATTVSKVDNNNAINLTSTAVSKAGVSSEVSDVWFASTEATLSNSANTLASAILDIKEGVAKETSSSSNISDASIVNNGSEVVGQLALSIGAYSTQIDNSLVSSSTGINSITNNPIETLDKSVKGIFTDK